MRSFDYIESGETLLTPHITGLLAAIHKAKGRRNIQTAIKPDIPGALVAVARIQSTDASNRIEDISISGSRPNDPVPEKVTPRNRNEEEIAGYRDALSVIHENHNYVPTTLNVILQLHRDLFRYTPLTFTGHPKDSDNTTIERGAHGTSTVQFALLSALITLELIERACSVYTQAIRDGHTDPLLAIAMFILDFICIYPFNNDDGRTSRLFTPLMLRHNGCTVGKYISIGHLIEQDKDTYYEVLAANTQDWDGSANDYAPFTNYLLSIILSACRESDERIDLTAGGRAQGTLRVATKGAWIEALLDQSLVPLSKADVFARMSDTSTTAIEHTLKSLLNSGMVIRTGAGRNTRYVKRH